MGAFYGCAHWDTSIEFQHNETQQDQIRNSGTIFLLVKRFGSKGNRWPQYVIISSLNSIYSLVLPNLALNLKQKLMGIIIAIITR